MSTGEAIIVGMMAAVLAIGVVQGVTSGLKLIRRATGRHFGPEAPDTGQIVENEPLGWTRHSSVPQAPRPTPEQRLVAEYHAKEAEQEAIHRQARMAMHEAAGQGWRNVAE